MNIIIDYLIIILNLINIIYLQELNKCKTELQYWRSKSPAIPVCNGCGQSMPIPTEDFQALANQGVLPMAFSEALNFIPIDDSDSPTDNSSSQSSQSSQQSCQGLSPPPQSSEMAPPKAPLSTVATKRKLSSEDPTPSADGIKKPRRAIKSRQAKRSKI